MSPKPFTPDHQTQYDVEDVEALSTHTGAVYLFGLSSGAVIALMSALRIAMIRKAVIYEPPFYFKQGIDRERVERFHRDVRGECWLQAMTTAGEIVNLAPLPVRLLPRPIRERLTAGIMPKLGSGGGYARLEELLPAMRYDFQVVGEMS
jgi:pimeloyl-ACP methyl ester carboxylesterase